MTRLTRRELFAAAGLAAAGLAVGGSHATAQPPPTQAALADLTRTLRGSVIGPDGGRFTELATPRNLRFAATMPRAVVLCADADDVAKTVLWARNTGTSFAIRGGGHNYAEASSSRGVIISTRQMTAATIDGATLRAHAGVRNADLAALLPQGGGGRLLLPGGNCPGVGVVGLTLGGGIGPNAPWAGLTADRLRKVTMVTAHGDVVTASPTENPDLFWGLRGGAGGNFGVVTDLEYELVEVPVRRATTAELSVTGADAATRVALAFQQLRADAERIVTGNLYLGHAAGDVEAALTTQLLVDEADARDLLAPLTAIPGLTAEITEQPWWGAYAWYVTPPSPAYPFWDRSLYADQFLSGDALAAALEVVRRFPAGNDPERYGAMGLYGWVGGAVNDVAPDATAYVHRTARILVEMSSGWSPAPSGAPVAPIPPDIRDWEDELWETVLPHTTGRSYQNFPDPELADWPRAYYGANLDRLTRVNATWDPEDVFRYPQGIPPR
ncbi:FAD-binding oxidoreductase [Mycolicibacterium vanbaalenii]|uniref:FAD-binding oxidoreductase n=1 Tax=Mycolicibacterium vanbaalenii TaxID=110539 RepID=UPI0023BB10AA|nr:FAD-binding oxidoreductase [Mycolicibacterium vanbaalenii]